MTVATSASHRKRNVALWIIQGLLAALFLFSGVTKLILPIEEMTRQIALPGLFLRFIGVCEILGALGLILPGIFRVRTGLTPVAATALVIIMIGATVVNLVAGQRVAALITLVVGLLLAFVAYNRSKMLPRTE
jgi:hypothetical protein